MTKKDIIKENKIIEEQLDRLTEALEALIDSIINTPADEILKEVEEDYGDINFSANKVIEILKKAKENVDKGYVDE